MLATHLSSIYRVDYTAISGGGETHAGTIWVANANHAEAAMSIADPQLLARGIPLADGTVELPASIRYNAVMPAQSLPAVGESVLGLSIDIRVKIDGMGWLMIGGGPAASQAFTAYAVKTREYPTAAAEARAYASAALNLPDPDNPPVLVKPNLVTILSMVEVASIPLGSVLLQP